MPSLSYSPLYQQDRMWVAKYKDGSTLVEWEPSGKEHMYHEINHADLVEFHLISMNGDNDYLDKRTGYFHVDKKVYIFPLAGFDLNFKLIQFKQAHTDAIPTRPGHVLPKYAGFSLDDYNIGWETRKDDIHVKVILKVSSSGKKEFLFEMSFLDIKRKFGYNLRVK